MGRGISLSLGSRLLDRPCRAWVTTEIYGVAAELIGLMRSEPDCRALQDIYGCPPRVPETTITARSWRLR